MYRIQYIQDHDSLTYSVTIPGWSAHNLGYRTSATYPSAASTILYPKLNKCEQKLSIHPLVHLCLLVPFSSLLRAVGFFSTLAKDPNQFTQFQGHVKLSKRKTSLKKSDKQALQNLKNNKCVMQQYLR